MQVVIENEGRHFQTGARMRRYRVVLDCACRTRVEHHVLPVTAERLAVRCAFCGEERTIDLRGAERKPRTRQPRVVKVRETRCAHPECGKTFLVEYSEWKPGTPLLRSCPHCGTVKGILRKVAA